MDFGLDQGLIALAIGVVTLLTALVEKTRRENTRDHASVRSRLDDLRDDIHHLDDRVDNGFRMVHGRVDDHLNAHAELTDRKRGKKD